MSRFSSAIFLSTVLIAASAAPAYAYLDPGTGSMLLQAIIGGVAGGLLIGRVYWDKLKIFVARVISPSNSTTSTGGSD